MPRPARIDDLAGWWRAHWRVLLQTLGYAAIAIAGGLLWLPLGVALAGVALVLIANGF